MKSSILIKNRAGSRVARRAASSAELKDGIVLLGGTSVIIGLWAIACFMGGAMAGGGPLGLVKTWLAATGM